MIIKASPSATPTSGSSQVSQYFYFSLFKITQQEGHLCLCIFAFASGLLSIAGLLAHGKVYKHI